MASMMEYRRMLAERELASVWPQWQIVRLLGTGSFGEVYEIQRNEYGRVSRCALKILRQENQGPMPGDSYSNISRSNTSEEFITTVLKEIDIMERLKGAPNIVVIDDYQVTRNSDSCAVLIRMELLRNLGDYITSKQATIQDVIKIGVDICSALEYCEGQNIIHRDVKESNIFYSDMGYFKLGDFGISRQLSYAVNNGTMTSAGTINKMAPEVYNGKKYDHRVDIYSLGVVLYSLLNYGRPPFYPPYPAQVTAEEAMSADMTRLKGTPVPPLAGVDDELNRIICKACSPKPSGRYKSAAEFRDALLDYQEMLTTGRRPSRKRKKRETETDAVIYNPDGTVKVADNPGAGMDQNEGGGSGKIPAAAGIALIAAIVLIVGGISIWYMGQGRKKPSPQANAYTPPAATEQSESAAPDPASDPGGSEADPAEAAAGGGQEEEKHYAEPEEEASEEEEAYYGGGEGSAGNIFGYGDYEIPAQQSDGETQENSNGTVSVKDDDGNEMAVVSSPSWASSQSTNGGQIIYNSSDGTKSANIFFAKGSSAATLVSFVKDSFSNGTGNFDSVEFGEESDASVGDLNIHYVVIRLTKDNVKGVMYWGGIECAGGCVSISSSRLSEQDWPSFSPDEFFEDVACITLSE